MVNPKLPVATPKNEQDLPIVSGKKEEKFVWTKEKEK